VNGVARGKISREMVKRVEAVAMGRDHDFVTFEKSIGFVTRQPELIEKFL
jgi:hypothetical protein